jgi:hypothetical protein
MGGICYGLQRRLLLWRRRGRDWEVVGDRIWKHLRKFSGWMCTGCAAGVVIYAANMRANDLFFESRIPGIADVQRYELSASFDRSRAVVRIFFTVQLSCFIFAMNLLLRRLSDHASHSYYNEARDHDDDGSKRFDWRDCVGQYKLYYLVRSMHAVAMLLCALHAVSRVVLVAFLAERARLYDEAAAACDAEGKDTRSILDKRNWNDRVPFENVNKSIAASRVLETVVFLYTTSSFLLFSPACIVMFRRVEHRVDVIIREMSLRSDLGTVFLPYEFSPAAADGARSQVEMQVAETTNGARSQVEMQVVEARAFLRRLKTAAAVQWRRLMMCLVLVIAALALLSSHAVFHLTFAVAAKPKPDCDFNSCDSCQPVENLIDVYYTNMPEIPNLINPICSAVTFMFSLWLMTTKEDRALMLNPGRFRTDFVDLQTVQTDTSMRLKTERVRMGIDLL